MRPSHIHLVGLHQQCSGSKRRTDGELTADVCLAAERADATAEGTARDLAGFRAQRHFCENGRSEGGRKETEREGGKGQPPASARGERGWLK